ncbi:restriction endonuclease subunit S [uncultured Prevotella sp.]|uniref:restriction endonuclease subunit S n=1 Tax=uncultured Prevotella sp. TaxID=159272 RepID=UPI002583895E|nr:restriction endonuclease subunit S [uncultured Prevotella sp.]
MKKYESYKDSDVGWIGEIPSHWSCVKVKHLLRERVDKSEDGIGEPLSMSQKYGLIPTSQMDVVPNLATSYVGAKRTRQGDMVLNKLKAHLGVFALSAYDGLVSPDYAVYYGTGRADLEYLEYLFKTPLYVSEFIKKTTGVAIGFNRLYTDDLFSIPAHYPPMQEQKRIVDYLKDKTLKIEQYVSARERERELLDSLKQSEIANVVTKGLNPNVRMKDSGIPWIGMIPEHWETRTLSQMARVHFISNKNVHHQNLLSLSYGKIVCKDINTTEGLLPASFDNYQIVEDGNIVLRLTDLQNDHKSLRVGLSTQEGIITSAYLAIEAFTGILPKYLYFLLHSIDVKKVFYSMGNGLRQSLNWTELRKLKCIVPPIFEQQVIVDYIEAKLSKIDSCIADLQAEIDYLKEFKQRLISDVVTGQICVAEPQKGEQQ